MAAHSAAMDSFSRASQDILIQYSALNSQPYLHAALV